MRNRDRLKFALGRGASRGPCCDVPRSAANSRKTVSGAALIKKAGFYEGLFRSKSRRAIRDVVTVCPYET